jgi:hypothetical protein
VDLKGGVELSNICGMSVLGRGEESERNCPSRSATVTLVFPSVTVGKKRRGHCLHGSVRYCDKEHAKK